MKKNLQIFLISFLLVGLSETIINQVFLKPSYDSLASLWRSKDELGAYAPIFLGIYLVFASSFSYIFYLFRDNMDSIKGLKLGLALGFLSRFWYAYTNFIVLPISFGLALGWFVFGLIELGVIGLACGYFAERQNLRNRETIRG
ncbi:hypothetical protein [Leptospira sp. GIMC2001]|uniref:hypothetical protein n=1 Tax=Leptospira sp. GIMC2001 TaxID=1513297 RepID=UPI002349F319|nr:hypothetical protein [Leptospira sp. GIMC2001]WCL49910.1 hypothetical protein O4O04_03580 [Leptospira sp. GIMC2001]